MLGQRGRSTVTIPFRLFAAVFALVYFVVPCLQELFALNTLSARFYGTDSPEVVETAALAFIYFIVTLAGFLIVAPRGENLTVFRRAARTCAPTERGLVGALLGLQVSSAAVTLLLFWQVAVLDYSDFLSARISLHAGMAYILDPVLLGYTAALLLASPTFAADDVPKGGRAWLILLAVALTAGISLAAGKRLVAFVGLAYLVLARAILTVKRLHFGRLGLLVLLVIGCIGVTGQIRSNLQSKTYVDFRGAALSFLEAKTYVNELSSSFGQLEWLAYMKRKKGISWEFQRGSTYLAAVTLPVPRAFWQSKPTGAGPVLAEVARPGSYRGGGRYKSSMTTGCVLEAYLNGGATAILVVAVLHGFALGALARYGLRVRYRYQFVIYLITLALLGEMLIYGEFLGVIARAGILAGPIIAYTRCAGLFARARIIRRPRPGALALLGGHP